MSSFSEERNTEREVIAKRMTDLFDTRRERLRNLHLLSKDDITNNTAELSNIVNEFPQIRNRGHIVDEELRPIDKRDLAFCELYTIQHNLQHRKSNICETGNSHLTFTLKKVKPPRTQIEGSNIDFAVAIFHSIHGFQTQFFTYENMTSEDQGERSVQLKKGFALPLNLKDPNLHLAVMVLASNGTRARWCKATGSIRLDNIQESMDFNIHVAPPKDPNWSAFEQIQKGLGHPASEDEEKNFKFIMKAKEVPKSGLKDDDFIMDKIQVPTLLSKPVNRLNICLEKAKVTARAVYGDFFGVSLKVEVFDHAGKKVSCIVDKEGEMTDSYESLISPTNLRCEWKEQLCLDLGVPDAGTWRDHHVRFSIYKQQAEKIDGKLFAFSFLPLSMANNILSDNTHELFVFQVNQGRQPNTAEYYNKQAFYDSNMKKHALKGQNAKGFSVISTDSLTVRSMLESTEITEDAALRDLLHLFPESCPDVQMKEIFERFSKGNFTHQAKRVLFMSDLLQKLWNIMTSLPKQKDNVFHSFIETIHPLVTNSRDYGYADSVLEDYLKNKFSSTTVFSSFIQSFSTILSDQGKNMTNPSLFLYTMMSMKYIFKFIAQSFKLNQKKDKNFDSRPLANLMGVLEEFLLVPDIDAKSKNAQSKAFQTLFEVETINAICEVLPNTVLINIFERVLSERDKTNNVRDCNSFNAVGRVLKSNLFNHDSDDQIHLCNIALSLIMNQFKKKGRSNTFCRAFLEDGCAFKEKTMEVIKDLYEVCRKPGAGQEQRKNFIRKITEDLLPELTSIIPDRASREDARRLKDKTFHGKDPPKVEKIKEKESKAQKLEEVMFFTLLSEVDDDIFNKISQKEDAPHFFDHLFKICQNLEDFSLPDDSFLLKMLSLKYMSNLLKIVSQKGVLEVTKKNLPSVENYLAAIAALMSVDELAQEKLTKENRRHAKTQFGDMRKELTELINKTVKRLPTEDIKELISDTNSKTMGTLFDAIVNAPEEDGTDGSGMERNLLINTVFEVVASEFFARRDKKVNGSIFWSYNWFINQVLTLKTTCIENLRDSFFTKMEEHLDELEATWETRENFLTVTDEELIQFKVKFKTWISHLRTLTSRKRDVNHVSTHTGCDNGDKNKGYFGEVTAFYYLYKALQEVKKEAIENGLATEDEDEEDKDDAPFREECFSVLSSLYESFDFISRGPDRSSDDDNTKEDFISAGYTLYEMGKLIPWSAKRATSQLVLKVISWASKGQVGDDNRLLKPGATWSQVKDEVRNLAIKKFEDASGFECSVQIMEKSIERYKTEVFDFKELANAYRALANIYDYRHDFTKKLKEVTCDRRKGDLQDNRRNILYPEYYKLTFFNTPAWLKFLDSKSFIYRGDAMLQPSMMWDKLSAWFPGCNIAKEEQDGFRNSKGTVMTIECLKVNIPVQV